MCVYSGRRRVQCIASRVHLLGDDWDDFVTLLSRAHDFSITDFYDRDDFVTLLYRVYDFSITDFHVFDDFVTLLSRADDFSITDFHD